MCHLSRLRAAERAALAQMPAPYRKVLEQEVEQLPSDGPTVRELFAKWQARVAEVDNVRRAAWITEDLVTETLADLGVLDALQLRSRREYLAALRREETADRLLLSPR